MVRQWLQGAEFDYESSWGEQLESVVHPVPVVLDLKSEKVTLVDTSQSGKISGKDCAGKPTVNGDTACDLQLVKQCGCPET